MKLIERLKQEQRSIIFFNHGLGDFILFLPVYKEILRQTGKRIDLGVSSYRQFHKLYPNVVLTDKVDVKSRYSFIYNVKYREPEKGISKPYHCAYNEFGLDQFTWTEHEFKNIEETESKTIGVQFFGLSGFKGESKFCPPKVAEKIWKEIEQAGFKPFELYQRVNFAKNYFLNMDIPDRFDLATEENSLRFQEPSMDLVFNKIKKCRTVISVDSGLLYLAISTIGKQNVIGLENKKQISKFLPIDINKVNVNDYQKNSILKSLEG
jgi:hypothetical protein